MLFLFAFFVPYFYSSTSRLIGQQICNRQYGIELLQSSKANRLDFLNVNREVLPTLLRENASNQSVFTPAVFRSKTSWKSTLRHSARSAAVKTSSFDPEDILANNTVSMLVDLVLGPRRDIVMTDCEARHHDIVSCIRCLQYCRKLTIIKQRRGDLMDIAGVLLAQKDIQTLVNLLDVIWKTANKKSREEDRLWRLTKAAVRLRMPIKVENLIAGSENSFDQSRPPQISYRALKIDIAFVRLFHTIWSLHIPFNETALFSDFKKMILFGLKLQIKTHLLIYKALHHAQVVESNNDYEKLLSGLFTELAILTSKDFSSANQTESYSLLYTILSQDVLFRTELMDYLSVALEFEDKKTALYIYSLFYQVELSQELPRPYLESLRGLISQHV